MGYSQHAGMVIVADGSEEAARRLRRVLWNDPGTGVMRHADAGYDMAIDCAREQGLDLPMIGCVGQRPFKLAFDLGEWSFTEPPSSSIAAIAATEISEATAHIRSRRHRACRAVA